MHLEHKITFRQFQFFSRGVICSYTFDLYWISSFESRYKPPSLSLALTAAWLVQLVERQSAVREVEGSRPRPDQHSGS